MNSLKVYLRSGYDRVYAFAQVAVGVLLLANGLKLLEEYGEMTAAVVSSGLFGLVMAVLVFALPKKIREQYRHIPGILLQIGGAVLLWNSMAMEFPSHSPWGTFLMITGIVVLVLGFSEPVLNIRPYIFFSKKGLRIRKHVFMVQRIGWKDIEQMDMGDKRLEVHLKNGQTVSMQPARYDSQHLRSRVDEMKRLAMQ